MDDVAEAINHFSALMEDQNAKLDAVLEGINSLPTRSEFHELRSDVAELKQDMKVVTAGVKATNNDVAAVDRRVTRLEAT